MARPEPTTRREYLQRYPRLCAHIIAESLGYATPQLAASILRDARLRRANYCEWITACYQQQPRRAVEAAIGNRHRHSGPMAEYRLALQIVQRALDTGQEPLFASWF